MKPSHVFVALGLACTAAIGIELYAQLSHFVVFLTGVLAGISFGLAWVKSERGSRDDD